MAVPPQQEPAQAPPPPPATELLTQLQDQLHHVSKMFFDFVGILQRDAPPLPLNDEPIVPRRSRQQQQQLDGQQSQQQQPQPPQFDVELTTSLMAKELVAAFKAAETLICALPDDAPPAADHEARIAALQAEHSEAAAALAAAAAEAEAQLGELQGLFARLAAQRMADEAAGVALPPLRLPPPDEG